MLDGTRKFSLVDESNKEMKRTLTTVYDALKEKGYNPINQIVGYLLSEDPTYITNHNNARSLSARSTATNSCRSWFSSIWITEFLQNNRIPYLRKNNRYLWRGRLFFILQNISVLCGLTFTADLLYL